MKFKNERSAGAVIFRREEGKICYLLLKSDYWGFPKGHIESGEDEKETLIREVKEETGIEDLEIREGFKREIKYIFRNVFDGNERGKPPLVRKTVVFYLAETKQEVVELSREHEDYCWLPFNKAYEKLTYKNYRKVLKKARQSLPQDADTR